MSVDLPDPLDPTIAMRSAHDTDTSTGPSRNSPRSTSAAESRATSSPLRSARATVRWSCHPSHGLSTASSRSMARSVAFALDASCSELSMFQRRTNLSLSVGFFAALRSPVTDHSR